MKISRAHLVQLQHAAAEQVHEAAGMQLNGHNYGLLPPGPQVRQSLDVQLYFDRSGYVTVSVPTCRGVTPGGVRLDLNPGTNALLPPVKGEFRLDDLRHPEYEIYLAVDPFARVPVGQPNPEETPLRRPFTLPQYRVELLPYPQTHQPENSAFQLTVGRLRVENSTVRLSEHYIPPCTSLLSHPRLTAAHQKLLSQLGEMEVAVTEIIQRVRGKAAPTPLDESILYLAEKMINFIANNLDVFRLQLLPQPPVQLATFFARFARAINVGLNALVRKQREELLDYFHEWFELAPREMENLLRVLLTLSYEHNDIYTSLNKVEVFADRLLVLLKKLGSLHYVKGQEREKETVYGWLAVHTESRKPAVYKINAKSLVIGRTDGNHMDVDFNITDDEWVSRRHARLSVLEERGQRLFQLSDLNSSNGTYIHDTQTRLKPNQEFLLMDGDTFQVGQTNIILYSPENVANERQLLSQLKTVPYLKLADLKEVIAG